MERVAVIGNSGGGKSGLARRLARRFALPYFELDALLWRPGWVLAPLAEYERSHNEIVAQDRWIADGLGARESIRPRLARATDIVLIDLPLWVHYWLAAERQIAWATGAITDPPGGIREMPPTEGLFRNICEIDQNWMPDIRQLAAAEADRGKALIHIHSLAELGAFAADGTGSA
jgi:hypothetical protein